ncbi:MAG: AAA family ATPase, partial [Defluviitaleaceae bacterium]|nr:AAA family ATPase [Defluviitaleaceae bacterium]
MKKLKNIKNNHKKLLLASIILIFGLALIIFGMKSDDNAEIAEFMPYADFASLAEVGHVEKVIVSDGALFRFTLRETDKIFETNNPRNPALIENLLLLGIAVSEEVGQESQTGVIIQNIFSLGTIALVMFVAFRVIGKSSGKNAMALDVVAADMDCRNTGFDAVAGNDEAKESVMDVIDFIKNPAKYAQYGARMPRGLIFYGPPGTGKTLMAKAIAAEAEVPFFATSGSDFVQMYVGVGAKRVRELFSKARENGRAVVFIDEIDAIGKSRGGGADRGNDERDQTLNALLTEMSGFENSEGIIVIAATNRLDTLDEALLRPGRFDRQIEINLPDFEGRKSILRVHSKNKPIAEDVDIADLARQTVYFSGAMLENLLNEAAIFAAKASTDKIGKDEIDAAYYTIVAGAQKKDRSQLREKDRQITAYHEAGHALAIKTLLPENIISKITIIPGTKGAAGFCANIPPDKMYYTKTELESQIIGLLAGRAAEEIIFGEDNITTGASNDISRAQSIAKDFVATYGMGSSGLGELS